MPLQPGAMNIPKFGVNISRVWSGDSGWPSDIAKARATCAETRCNGRSTYTLKMCGTGLTNHVSTIGNSDARYSLVPPNKSTIPEVYANATSECGGR